MTILCENEISSLRELTAGWPIRWTANQIAGRVVVTVIMTVNKHRSIVEVDLLWRDVMIAGDRVRLAQRTDGISDVVKFGVHGDCDELRL